MSLQLCGAYPVDSVMTKRLCRRAKLDGEPTHAQHRFTRTSSLTRPAFLSPATPSSASSLKPTSLSQESKEFTSRRIKLNATIKVRILPDLFPIVLLAVLVLISQPAMAKPWSNEQPDYVVFRTQICQPVSPATLKQMMGNNFDDTKMAPDSTTAKKMFGSATEDQGSQDYQGDDPDADLVDDMVAGEGQDNWKYVESDSLGEKEQYTQKKKGVIDETGNEEGRSWLPRKRVINRHVANTAGNGKQSRNSRNNLDDIADGASENKRQITNSDSYTYMRRRRRSHADSATRSPQANQGGNNPENMDTGDVVNNGDNGDENDGDIDAKDKKSTNSIQLQLFLSGKDKKQRKKLKHKLRQKPTILGQPPPWECKFSQRHRQMSKGVFPEWLVEGSCETDKCFYRLYDCEPIKYTLKLMQRDPTKCNPLPNMTNTTVYEERWELVPRYVTVGCNCVSPIIRNTKPKSRRRD